MEIDPFDERELYNRQQHSRNDVVSTTISTIVIHGGPLQLVIALLRVRKIFMVAQCAYRISINDVCHLIFFKICLMQKF